MSSSTPARIPFNRPYVGGREMHYVGQAILSSGISGDGRLTKDCAALLEERFGIHKVLMTPSCTASLEMAAMLCDLKPGDEVILPSYTFVSTASCVVRMGATPVFVDIREDTLNLDEELVEQAITPRTRAILPVHYAGVGCNMDRLMAIAAEHNLFVIEDAAQGVNAHYRGKGLGSIGHLGAYSFHDTKNYVCGEGGALCINSPELAERADILRDKGTNRSRFLRGLVDKYTWVDVGSSYVPSEIACAFLYAQLEMLDEINERRGQVYDRYNELLRPLEESGALRLPSVPDDCETNHHLYFVLMPDAASRNALLEHLRSRGIAAVFHYIPLHSSPMGQQCGYNRHELPVTDFVSERLLRLPLYCELSAENQQLIVEEITLFVERQGRKRFAA